MMTYPLATSTWDDKEIAAIQSVIDKGHYSMGEMVQSYEKEFSKFLNSKYCVMTSSGSTANLLMIAALFFKKKNPLKRGDEVIVPAVSWSTTYFPLQQYGLKVKFVDVDAETLNFNLSDLKDAITPSTKLILAVNLLGNSNDFSQIKEFIKDKDIYLVEDNCESLGATFEEKQTGTFGLMGTFSSFFSHHIATMEGGIVTTDDEEIYHLLLCLRAHGWTRNLPKFNHVTGEKSDDPFSESFKFILPGYNVRPLEMSGAIGIEQLIKLPSFIEERRKNAGYFCELFANDERFIIQKEIGKSSWFGFSFIIRPSVGLDRKDLVKKLMDSKIDVRPIVAGNFVKNEAVKYFDYSVHNNLKNADLVDKNGFFVGNHQYPLKDELTYLKKTL
jgi:dTDP-4-amino-4,6-dideoxygalactose transaminase